MDIDGGVSDHSAPVGCPSKFSVRSCRCSQEQFVLVVTLRVLYVNPIYGIIVFFFFGEELEYQIVKGIYVRFVEAAT